MSHETGNVIDEVYLHISNGGVTFAVRDSGRGPEVVVESSTFGNNVITQRVLVAPRVLARLGELFARAADHAAAGKFSETYCCEADYRDDRDHGGCDEKCMAGGQPPGGDPRHASAGAAPGSPN